MWLGVHIYTDGLFPDFKKAKTKKEIIEWLRDNGYEEAEIEEGYDQGDGISYELMEVPLNTAFIVNLNAKKTR